jgi:hypothetical protein
VWLLLGIQEKHQTPQVGSSPKTEVPLDIFIVKLLLLIFLATTTKCGYVKQQQQVA